MVTEDTVGLSHCQCIHWGRMSHSLVVTSVNFTCVMQGILGTCKPLFDLMQPLPFNIQSCQHSNHLKFNSSFVEFFFYCTLFSHVFLNRVLVLGHGFVFLLPPLLPGCIWQCLLKGATYCLIDKDSASSADLSNRKVFYS